MTRSFVFIALMVIALPLFSDATGCIDCSNCAICTSKSFYDTGVVKVTIDVGSCKGSSISWFCCRGSQKPEMTSDSFCDLYHCNSPTLEDWESEKNKCNTVSVLEYLVPTDATSIIVQLHDGQFNGNVACTTPGACCGGSGTSCPSATSGVCQTTIDLSTCGTMRECTTDSDCDHLNTACASGSCSAEGLCGKTLHPQGTVCRPALDPCDVSETCSGVSDQCPDDLRNDDGYSFKCGTTQYLCGLEASDLTLNNGGAWVIGTANAKPCVIGTGVSVVQLPWPHCVTQCLETLCPNQKRISNYALASCNVTNGYWDCDQKTDVPYDYVPVCPYAL